MYYKSLYLKSNLNMAEKKKNSNSNSNNTNLKFLINAQFLKDLSFEIAGAKTYFLLQKDIKDFLVNFDIVFE